MSVILTLVKNNFRMLVLKKPMNTVMMVVAPVVIAIFVSMVMNKGQKPLKVAVLDNSKSISSEAIINSISKEGTFEIINNNSVEELESEFTTSSVNVAIIFEGDFEEKLMKGDTTGVFIKGLEGSSNYKIISSILGLELSNMKNLAIVNNGDIYNYKESLSRYESSNIHIAKESLNDLYGDYTNSQSIIGFLVMFALFRAMAVTTVIGKDKEQRIYTRILVAPAQQWQYYLANLISTLSLILLQITLSIIGIKIFTEINMGMSNLQLFLVLAAIGILAVSIGCLCATVTDNRDLSSIISNIILSPILFLGGCFVPIQFLSPTINKISYFTPIRWAMEAIVDFQQGAGNIKALQDLGVVMLFAVAFFVAAIYCVTRRDSVDEIG